MPRYTMQEKFHARSLTYSVIRKFLDDAVDRGCPDDASISFHEYTNSESATTYVTVSVAWDE